MKQGLSVVLALLIVACTGEAGDDDRSAGSEVDAGADTVGQDGGEDANTPVPRTIPPPTFNPAVDRIVAVGDIHGDMNSIQEMLIDIGILDRNLHWAAGETWLVQVGDQLDRGDDERDILEWLEVLADEAHAAGGAAHVLLGNHELMNVDFDFRYVTEGGWLDFADVPYDEDDPVIQQFEEFERGRVAAFRPGGPYARLLAEHNTIEQIGDNVFVHGGVLPHHAEYGLEAINDEVQAWMRGERSRPSISEGSDSPIWSRHYSDDEVSADDCALLEQTLDALNAERMIVGHTVQYDLGINSDCDGKVWRVDVGIADYYGGPGQALEIMGDTIRVLE